MKSIIVAYPNKNMAMRLRNALSENGLYVSHICATGASALGIAGDLHSGVIVTATILSDMTAAVLAERLPSDFDVVALSKNGCEEYMSNLITLRLPLDKQEFLRTIEILVTSRSSYTERDNEELVYISNAKAILMNINGFDEMHAHKYLQQMSMKQGKKIAEIAKEIIADYH